MTSCLLPNSSNNYAERERGGPFQGPALSVPYATVFATLRLLPLLNCLLSYCLVLFACARASQIHPKFNLIALLNLTFLVVYSIPLAFLSPSLPKTIQRDSLSPSSSPPHTLLPSSHRPRRRFVRCGSWPFSLPSIVVVQKCVLALLVFHQLFFFFFFSLPQTFLLFDITRRVLRSPRRHNYFKNNI